MYRPFGGCGYIEYTSVEKSSFSKKNEHPTTLYDTVNPLFWFSQLKKSIYNRVSTTTLWVSLLLCPAALNFNHPH